MMFYELNPGDYRKIMDNFKGIQNHVVINGIIDNNNLGSIYVDNINYPRTAVIWGKQEMCYLVGDINNLEDNSLERLVFDDIALEAEKIDDECFQIQTVPEQKSIPIIEEKFKHKQLKKYYRWKFSFNIEKYNQLKEIKYGLPDGYCVRRIDKSILQIDEDGIIKEEIGKFWPSLEEYFNKGIGFCILYGNQVVSTCISAYVSGKNHEISVNTYSLRHRKKGLAFVISKMFVDYCVTNNLSPHWGTETFRYGSIKIAQKCGFEKLDTYCFYCFDYDDMRNLVLSIDYCLGNELNIGLAEEYFSMVISNYELSANEYYWLGSCWAGVKEIDKAIFCINTAVEKGYSNLDNLIYNENFNILHSTDKWKKIIAKIK